MPKRSARPVRRSPRAARAGGPGLSTSPTVRAFQAQIEALYGARDRRRGLPETFMWFAEEVGELSRALRRTDRSNLEAEFADVFAWLVTLASLAGVDLARAVRKYGRGCPRCAATPCDCAPRRS